MQPSGGSFQSSSNNHPNNDGSAAHQNSPTRGQDDGSYREGPYQPQAKPQPQGQVS
jgi:hypothetical protein